MGGQGEEIMYCSVLHKLPSRLMIPGKIMIRKMTKIFFFSSKDRYRQLNLLQQYCQTDRNICLYCCDSQ